MLTLRPHHLIDVIAGIGRGNEIKPHPYGHDVHTVTQIVIQNPCIEVKFINGGDDICKPCIHLQNNNICDDVLHQLDPPISKQAYNDRLDTRLFDYLKMKEGEVMELPAFLKKIENKIPGIEKICTHPKRDEAEKLNSIKKGVELLSNQ